MSITNRSTVTRYYSVILGVRHLLLLSLTLLLTGCPVPCVYHQWPDFSGVVTRGGTPIADAKVRYSTDRKAVNCSQPAGEVISPDEDSKAFHYYSEEVTSSADGGFFFPGDRSFFYVWFIIPGIAEYIEYWHLCVRTTDGQRFQKEVSVSWGGMWNAIPEWTPDSVKIVGTCDVLSGDICETHRLTP
jgi:hypothetical protein